MFSCRRTFVPELNGCKEVIPAICGIVTCVITASRCLLELLFCVNMLLVSFVEMVLMSVEVAYLIAVCEGF